MQYLKKINMITLSVVVALLVFSAASFAADAAKPFSKEDQAKYDLAFESALVHYEKAQLLYDAKKMEDVTKELKIIVDLEFPAGSERTDGARLQLDMHSFLGEIYIDLKKYKEAVDVLLAGIKKAPEIDKTTYQLYMTLGHAYKKLEKVDDALKAFEQAEKINKVLLEQEKKEKKEAAKTEK